MDGTHFCDSTGLHNPDHYSTAKDMAVLLQYALKNDTFREIAESPWHLLPVTNVHPDGITYYSTMFKNFQRTSVQEGKDSGRKNRFYQMRQEAVWQALQKSKAWNISL